MSIHVQVHMHTEHTYIQCVSHVNVHMYKYMYVVCVYVHM